MRVCALEPTNGAVSNQFAVLLQAVSISYGVCAGLRGFFFSLLNTELIQTLRYAPCPTPQAASCQLTQPSLTTGLVCIAGGSRPQQRQLQHSIGHH